MKIFVDKLDPKRYLIVKYFLESHKDSSLRDVAWALAIGQSVGNPNVRSKWETEELFENHSCLIEGSEKVLKNMRSGNISIGFPITNIDFETDGISQMLVQIMGGQLDIDIVQKCHVVEIKFPKSIDKIFKGPKYGITGIRKFTNSYNKPILGGIIKPKVGVTPQVLLEMVKELVEGGINFIKEDEIMSNPSVCLLEERVPLIMSYLKGKNVIYAVSITSDFPYVIDRVKRVHRLGGNAVHINFWNGLGVYNTVRKLDLPLFLFFQKSGDKILTNKKHDFHIEWDVVCKLAGMMGVDFIHAGMWGGYLDDNEASLKRTLSILQSHNVMPSLSCGMHAGLIEATNTRFGFDYMANVGGAIHGHPGGSKAGTMALRQSIDKKYGKEYKQSIDKWGLVE